MIQFIADLFKDNKGSPLSYIKEIKRLEYVTIIRFRGKIDSSSIPVIRSNMGDMEKYFDRNLIIDFKDVTNVDTSTLAAIIFMLCQLQKHNRKLGLINATPQLDHHIHLDKVETLVYEYENEMNAIKDLNIK